MARERGKSSSSNNSAPLGFEAKLWLAADKLRGNMDAAKCKHVVLGLIFLKYISNSFEEDLAGARRLLFLVDLGDQTLIPPSRDQQFVTPDDGRKFIELYNVQHL